MDLSALGLWNGGLVVAASFVAVGFWEHFRPERRMTWPAGRRWLVNFALYAASMAVGGGLGILLGERAGAWLPTLPLGADRIGPVAHAALVILALDLAHYWVHRLFHAQLWRVHAVHHTDPDPDVSTSLRHHPVELVPVTAITVFVAGVCGASAAELAAYGTLAFAVQVLAHANVALPPTLAAALQAIVVTPGFHRLHHSRDERECHANYGQVFTFWDRLFGTEITPSGEAVTAYGVDAYAAARFQNLGTILVQPLLRPEGYGAEAAARGDVRMRAASARRGAPSGRGAIARPASRRRVQRR